MAKLIDQLINSSFVVSYAYSVLSACTGKFTQEDVKLLATQTINDVKARGPKMYKVYTIPKRNGGKRLIAHPSKPLKATQRALVEVLQKKLPVHEAAFAYRSGLSIRDNALVHSKNRYFLKLDLSDFFNSIDVDLFESQLASNRIFIRNKTLLNQIIFWSPTKDLQSKLKLSVGAPSSPLISNFIMYRFDKDMSKICDSLNVRYTRYADDLFFSTNIKDILFDIPELVNYILDKRYDNKLLVNKSKTSFSSKAHNRHITGVTITNEGKLSIGRGKKRYISSLVHKYNLGLLEYEDMEKLQGLLGFAKHIEPSFIIKLSKKYSHQSVEYIAKGGWKNNE
ncbi:RNA-directed DNA polymerase [Vibrio owensii]|nr:RNA-directed DNA polymerase [Vibrio owensii]